MRMSRGGNQHNMLVSTPVTHKIQKYKHRVTQHNSTLQKFSLFKISKVTPQCKRVISCRDSYLFKCLTVDGTNGFLRCSTWQYIVLSLHSDANSSKFELRAGGKLNNQGSQVWPLMMVICRSLRQTSYSRLLVCVQHLCVHSPAWVLVLPFFVSSRGKRDVSSWLASLSHKLPMCSTRLRVWRLWWLLWLKWWGRLHVSVMWSYHRVPVYWHWKVLLFWLISSWLKPHSSRTFDMWQYVV